MPLIGLIDCPDIRPCNECLNHKTTHFSNLLKTQSLRQGLSKNDIYSSPNKKRSYKPHCRFEDTDSSSTQSEPLTDRLQPSQSFLHREYSRINALKNSSRNLTSQEIEPKVITVEHISRDLPAENDDPNYEPVLAGRNMATEPLPANICAAATQTSAKNTIIRNTKTFCNNIESNKDNVANFIVRASGFEEKKSKSRLCSKSSCILICGYLAMIIIGIVISVVVSQREQQQFQARPRRPTSFQGAQLSQENRRRVSPQAVSPDRVFDFYDDTNTASGSAPSVFPPFPNAPTPSQPAPTPVRVAPKQRVEVVRPSQATTTNARKRQGPSKNFQHQFGIEDTVQEEVPIGRKEPKVKIIKSWANTHADGSYTWGYINTDGSFKNETRGADCVVRGIYGYVDEHTGQTISHPYVSGNPCDPNEPDYYYDYDERTINSDGAVVQARNPQREVRRRLQ